MQQGSFLPVWLELSMPSPIHILTLQLCKIPHAGICTFNSRKKMITNLQTELLFISSVLARFSLTCQFI